MTAAAFWDKIAAKYAAQPISDPVAYEETLARTRAYLEDSFRLLEIGCGTGGTALKLAPFVAHLTGTDISGEMIKIGRAKLGLDTPGNVDFLCADANATVPGAPFDAICAFNILHLVPDLSATLHHLYDQTRPDGVVISKTPCIGEMSIFVRAMIPIIKLFGKAPDVNGFRKAELEATFGEVGFEIVETGHFGKDQNTHFVVARRIG
ncbi:MAG: class I SAM-dependent methyltransferase [Rhodobacteraceae bacterium]|nr:class I SAM-dependent methyltransferase [Paracoccaceae bacterium]